MRVDLGNLFAGSCWTYIWSWLSINGRKVGAIQSHFRDERTNWWLGALERKKSLACNGRRETKKEEEKAEHSLSFERHPFILLHFYTTRPHGFLSNTSQSTHSHHSNEKKRDWYTASNPFTSIEGFQRQ
ncbi:hypothetical protein K2173_012308 [Erythroxylum novogranatense]|uniref:Uncharacterized protein n=1 Tax=Erythroxylum novogranatense TaxID=1862640 RepID=A0AAV8SC27_9ROSI|nr:hypothetical protein K2173_012308 [Erythroxylum novogranatense]